MRGHGAAAGSAGGPPQRPSAQELRFRSDLQIDVGEVSFPQRARAHADDRPGVPLQRRLLLLWVGVDDVPACPRAEHRALSPAARGEQFPRTAAAWFVVRYHWPPNDDRRDL